MIAKENQNGIVVLKWKDARNVRMLSTKHAPIMAPISTQLQSFAPTQLSQPSPFAQQSTCAYHLRYQLSTVSHYKC